MLKIGVVLLDNGYCSSIGGLIDLLQIANSHCQRLPTFANNLFQWSLLSDRAGEAVSMIGGVRMLSDTSLHTTDKFDLVYLPGVFYSGTRTFEAWLSDQQDLYKQLRDWNDQGVKIAANCTSTFLLAEAGLLERRSATTAWWLERQFRYRYPNVNLNAKLALTEDENIFCAGAMTACHQLTLRIIEKYASPEISTLSAKTMLINQGEVAQTPYQDLNAPIANKDPLISRAQYWLNNHMTTEVDFSLLSKALNISQRTLIRRFKQAVGTTPLNYLQNLRIEQAKALLSQSPLTVADIMLQIGYRDPSAFNRLFKQRVGITPSAYRQRYGESQ